MKKKLEKIILIILIIEMMLLSNFIFVGKSMVEAAEQSIQQEKTTNSKNIEFSAYFKQEDETKTLLKEVNLNVTEKLYLQIEIKKEGYFNGFFKLENTNMELKNTILSDKVEKIEGNQIKLKELKAGEKVEIPVEIELTRKEEIEKSFIESETEVKIEGIYKDSTQKDIPIEGISKVYTKWVSKNKEIVLDNKLITNKTYLIENFNKTLYQTSVKTGLKENDYVIKQNKIEMQIPLHQKVEKVEVLGMEINTPVIEKDYTFNIETGILEINILNEENEGKIKWQNKQNQLLITIQYQEEVNLLEQELKINNEINLYDDSETKIQTEQNFSIQEEKDGLITYEIETEEEEFYKGKLIAGEERKYQKSSVIYINDLSIKKQFEIVEEEETYEVEDKRYVAQSIYQETQINKQDLENVLGESGILRILDSEGTILSEISSKSDTNEDDNIIIPYPENIKAIKIQLLEVENRGILTLTHHKVIKEEKNNEIVQKATQLIQTIGGKAGLIEKKIKMESSKEAIQTQINKSDLTALEKNENIELRTTLLTNNESYKLYKNPKFEIEFPEKIENIEVKSIRLFYEDEIRIVKAGLKTVNNKKIIEIQTEGEQTFYKEQIQNTMLSILADIKINIESESSKEQINVKVTNNETEIQSVIEFNICTVEEVESLNNIEDYNLESNEMGKEQSTLVGNTNEEKQTQINQNVETTLIGTIGGEKLEKGDIVKIGEVIEYQFEAKNTGNTEIQNAQIKVTVPNNAVWVEPDEGQYGYEYTGARYYKEKEEKEITLNIDKIGIGESIIRTYEIRVREDEQSTNLVSVAQLVVDDQIYTTNQWDNTIENANLRISLKQVTDRDSNIVEGNSISYYVIVENISNEKQENVIVEPILSTGVQIQNFITKKVENGELLDDQWIEPSKDVNIGDIEPNEVVSLEIVVFVDKVDTSKNYIEVKAIAKSDQQQWCRSNVFTTDVKGVDISLSMTSTNESESIKKGDVFEYHIDIKNNTKTQTTLKIADEIPEQFDVLFIKKDGEIIQEQIGEGDDISYVSNDIEEILTLDAEQIVSYIIKVKVRYIDEEETPQLSNIAILSVNGSEKARVEIIHKCKEFINVEENPNSTYSINGRVWIDSNKNGQKETNEGTLSEIKVMLLDSITGMIAKNDNDYEMITTTDTQGKYEFNELVKGKYMVVFEYDTKLYELTQYQKEGILQAENSDVIARKIEIDGQEKEYATTDTIVIENKDFTNIDMGLNELDKFELSLNKNIHKIIVQYSKGTEMYQYDNIKLAKIELDGSQMNGANIVIEYEIKIKNTGKISGYAKTILDEMPKGLSFSSTLNTDWYQINENLYNDSLSNEKINPGEEKTIMLVLTKTLTENDSNMISNNAKIIKLYSETGIEQNEEGEIPQGQADIIIGIKTGTIYLYIGLAILVTSMLIIGIYLIIKKVLIK